MRPKTSQSQLSPTTEKNIITLVPNANKRLLTSFPKDPFSDIIIQCKSKRFELQRAHLRIEAQYFENSPNITSLDVDPEILENILRYFYGGCYQIAKYSEVYLCYQIAQTLKSDSICKQIEMSIQISQSNFCLMFQLAETYNLEDIRQQCYDYLDSDEQAFKVLFDVGRLQLHKQHKKATPSDVLAMNEHCFKTLIHTHNTYKNNDKKYISMSQMFQVVKMYCQNEDQLKRMIVTLFDREKLTSAEYQEIYHEIAIKDHQEIFQEPPIQKCHGSVKDGEMKVVLHHFDFNESQHYLDKLLITELKRENQLLKSQNTSLSIQVETVMKSTMNLKETLQETILETINNKVTERDYQIEQLKEQIETLQRELMNRDLKADSSSFNEREVDTMMNYTENLLESEVFNEMKQTFQTVTSNTLLVSQNKKYHVDIEPITLDNQNQLNYLFAHLNTSIFQQVKMKHIYWGSRDGYEVKNFQDACDGYNNVLVLCKSFDYNLIFGVYIKGEFAPGDLNTEVLLLYISSQQLETYSEVKICDSDMLIQVGDLRILNECASITNNEGSVSLCGAKHFQVDDIEAFAVSVSNEM